MASNNKVAIIVAVVGLVGVLGAAVIANVDKIFGNQKDKPFDYQPMAEKLTNDFIDSWKAEDVNSMTALISTPFFFDHNILTSSAEVHDAFKNLFVEKANEPSKKPSVKSIKVKTIAQWKSEGILTNQNDRVLKNLDIPDDGYYAIITFENNESLAIVFRKLPDDLKIAGMWD